MAEPRVPGWDSRKAMSSNPFGAYQAVCGHYLESNEYACVSCNIAPLTELIRMREALAFYANVDNRYSWLRDMESDQGKRAREAMGRWA